MSEEFSNSSSSTEQNNANDRELSFSVPQMETVPVRILLYRNHRHHGAMMKLRLSPEEIDNLPQRPRVPHFFWQRPVRIINLLLYASHCQRWQFPPLPSLKGMMKYTKIWVGGKGGVEWFFKKSAEETSCCLS